MKRDLLGPQNSTGKNQAKKTMKLQIWTTFHGKERMTHRAEPRTRRQETRAIEKHSWTEAEQSSNQGTSNIYPNKHQNCYESVTSLCLPFLSLFFFSFIGSHPRHMEVPRLGGKLEPQLPVYTTATAMPDASCICNLYCSSWQLWILNPLSRARNQTHILMDTSQVHYH